LVNVGTAIDAVNETAATDTVAFTLIDNDGREQRFAFDYPRGEGESYILRGMPGVPYNPNHCLFASRFNYLHAERVGPRVLYPMSEMIEDLIDVGIHGEYTAHCLDRFGSMPIPNPNLVHGEGTSSRLLFDQTRYWMSEIVPDLDIDLKAITEADQMRIGLKTSTGRFLRPTNIGFGIIYTLPVIVATSMQEAVERAYEAARPDGVVLLAPACASFDWFRDYAERGRSFKEEVEKLKRRVEG